MARGKPHVIITTDLEVDDMNSLIHLALYLNVLDVEAIVTTASQYHFLGDNKHTLGEVNSHWRTKGKRAYELKVVPREPDPEAGKLSEYRPFPKDWIKNLWSNEYAEAWPHLCANAQAAGEDLFPSPEEMIERTFAGNVAFEGDVREDTPGSNVIKQAILDEDCTLWLLSWGGMNTIVRALMSIAEDYQDTPEWEDVRKRIYDNVRVMGVFDGIGQDNSWLDHGKALFPELKLLRTPFAYGGYVDALAAQPDSIELFRAPWPEENLVQNNGPLMARYMLYGDGKRYENEPERFQFGLTSTLDWGIDGMPAMHFTPGDFMAEGDSMTYIPLLGFGLRGIDNPQFNTLLGPMFNDGETAASTIDIAHAGKALQTNVNPFLRAYQEDFAARAQWCAAEPSSCNHAPIIKQVSPDTQAKPGEIINLSVLASDPDGDELSYLWWLDTQCSSCAKEEVWQANTPQACYTIPSEAQSGERFVLTLAVKDNTERPMTRYAQVEIDII